MLKSILPTSVTPPLTVLTKKNFFQIDECHCGKSPFRYHNSSKNIFIVKCNTRKEEYDLKTRKWVLNKKQPCNLHCAYYGERVVLEEVKNKLILKAKTSYICKDKILEEKLRLLFQFVFVSNHSSTLDEINILVKNSLKEEPRKKGESLEDYEERVFSKKIVDLSHIEPVKPKINDVVFLDVTKILKIDKINKIENKENNAFVRKPRNVKKPILSSRFIVVSDDDISTNDPENESDRDSESDRELSDYDTEDEKFITEEVEEPEEPEDLDGSYDDFESDGGNYDGYD